MKNKSVGLFFLLAIVGIAMLFLSLIPFPIRSTEAYIIPNSGICYDHLWFSISTNSTEYKAVGGPGFNSTLYAGSTLNISLQVQTGNVDFHVEAINASIKYIQLHMNYESAEYIPTLRLYSDWLTIESYQSTSYLTVTHTVPKGIWLYRLRFENADTQTNRTVELCVTENWTETDLKEVVTSRYLLPFEFMYLGVILSGSALGLATWGITTEKFDTADLRKFIRKVFDSISHYIQTREVILISIMTFILLFLSIFVHTRLGVGEISADGKTIKTFFLYYGFPLETMGIVTPITSAQWQILSTTFVEAVNIGHSMGMWSGLTWVTYYEPVSGRLLILWDGLFLNFLFYFALSFFLVITLIYMKERLTHASI